MRLLNQVGAAGVGRRQTCARTELLCDAHVWQGDGAMDRRRCGNSHALPLSLHAADRQRQGAHPLLPGMLQGSHLLLHGRSTCSLSLSAAAATNATGIRPVA